MKIKLFPSQRDQNIVIKNGGSISGELKPIGYFQLFEKLEIWHKDESNLGVHLRLPV